jgi:hypothetical protein
MEDITNVAGALKRDTQKILDVVSKVLMPVLLLVLGTWFNFATGSNQEKQRAQEQKLADDQSKSMLIESYIKHLTSVNPAERDLALHIITLEADRFDVSLVNLVTAYAAVGTPSERITALEALSHAAHSKDTAVRGAASRNIRTIPAIPVSETDTKLVQQKAAIVNQALDAAHLKPDVLNKFFDQLPRLK